MSLRYFTDAGIEVPAVTTEQMIEVDRVAIEDTGPNLLQMMENAGRNLALQAIASLGETWRGANIVVLVSASKRHPFGSSAALQDTSSSRAAIGCEAEVRTEFSATKMCMAASAVKRSFNSL